MPQSGLPRNVNVYDNCDNASPLLVAGLQQFGLTTSADFYFCLEICFQQPTTSNFRLWAADGTILSRENAATIVPTGDYYVISAGMDLICSS